jgi:DNA-binding transcriptional MerR regulator
MTSYRMRDLCAMTGLSRQAIHFYIQQGLVPEGHKTGRNMAYYTAEHVERLRLVRRLQDERYMPLKKIRALLDGDTERVGERERELELEVRARLSTVARGNDATPRLVDVDRIAADRGVARGDLDRMIELGLIEIRDTVDDARMAAADSVWLVDVWGQLRTLGFTADRGFAVDDLVQLRDAVARMLDHEASLLGRLADVPAPRLADMVERALPLINALIVQLHAAAVRDRLAA